MLVSACPRVKQNTQRFPASNVFFIDDKDTKVITQIGFVKTPQRQEILTGSGVLSKNNDSSNHLLFGSWFKAAPDLALGAVLSPLKDASFSGQYKIFNSNGLNWYAGLQVSNDYGLQTAVTFQNIGEKSIPFVSIKYRQVNRFFESYPDPEPNNSVHVREDIMDYQLGAQFSLDFIRSENVFNSSYFKNFYVQLIMGSSQISKTEILSENYPSNYKDELGFTYGLSVFNEF